MTAPATSPTATRTVARGTDTQPKAVRRRVQHPWAIVAFVALGLANIYLARATLYAQVRP